MSVTTEEAEWLAAVFNRRGPDGGASINGVIYGTVSATLRSLAAERDALQARVAELEGGLERLARLGAEPYYGNSDGNMIARAALERKKNE